LQELWEWARAAFDTYDLLLAGFTGLAPSLSKPQFDDLARLPACSVVIEVFDSTTVRCAAHSTKVIERLSETWRTAAIERVPWG
jgi:hypothetical protein